MMTSTKREDLLNAAEELFYEHGFHGVGLKQIIEEAGVANMTLYNQFSSKEGLVAEVLKQREQRYWTYLDELVSQEAQFPFVAAVKAHGEWLKDEPYKGCMFLRAIEEYAGVNEEIERIARSHKSKLLRYFQTLTQQRFNETDDHLAHYFTLLLEGTTSMATLIGAEEATVYAVDMAKNCFKNFSH